MDTFVLVGIGEILWDELPHSRRLGGAPANFAIHGSRLGGQGLVISAVGADGRGEEIRRVLADENVASHLVTDQHHPTGRVTVALDDKGGAEYTICKDVAWDYLPFEPLFPELARRADAVCFGTLAQRSTLTATTIRRFIEATGKDCLRFFDINLRASYYSAEIIAQLLELATHFKCNEEEFEIISTMFLSEDGETGKLRELRSLFSLQMIVLTKGGAGSRLFAGVEKDSQRMPEPCTIVDTIGAGDSFTAAVAIGVLSGLNLEKIHLHAGRVAARVCSFPGATPPGKSLLR